MLLPTGATSFSSGLSGPHPFFVVALPWRALSHRTSSLEGSYVEAAWYVLNDQPDHSSLAVGTERVLVFASYCGKTWSLPSWRQGYTCYCEWTNSNEALLELQKSTFSSSDFIYLTSIFVLWTVMFDSGCVYVCVWGGGLCISWWFSERLLIVFTYPMLSCLSSVLIGLWHLSRWAGSDRKFIWVEVLMSMPL